MESNDQWRRLRLLARNDAVLYVLALGLGVACFYLTSFVGRGRTVGAQSLVTPFILQTESYGYNADSKWQLLDRKTEARRSDGATVVVEDIALDTPSERTERKIIFMDGKIVTLSDSVSAKSTMFMASSDAGARHRQLMTHPPSNCVFTGETLLGFSTEMGQRVAIIRQSGVAHEDLIETWWRAPNLCCKRLRFQIQTKQTDGELKLAAEARPISLKLEEPPATLFDEGANYDEVKPSERLRRDLAKTGRTLASPTMRAAPMRCMTKATTRRAAN